MHARGSIWLRMLVVGVLLVGGWAGCGDDEASTTTSAEASSSTSPTSTTTTSTTTTTTPTTTTTGMSPRTEEAAIGAWISGRSGGPYLGPCPVDFDPEFQVEGLCSVPLTADDDQSVQGVGPPFSEITVYLLLDGSEDGWVVADTYAPAEPYDLSGAPGWVPHEPVDG